MTNSTNQKIAFFIDNSKIPNVNFSQPDLGNPGCGASEYVAVQVAAGLIKRGYVVKLYVTNLGKFPESIPIVKVSNLLDSLKHSILANEVLVHRLEVSSRSFVYDQITSKEGLRVIPWMQLTPSQKLARKLAREDSVISVIAVGGNQVTRLRDNPIFKKLHLISNPIATPAMKQNSDVEPPNQVVFVGALTPAKGFHILADQWANVRKRVPNATLKVIGSGSLYDKERILGNMSLADKNYEDRILRELQADESVEFLGTITDPLVKSKIVTNSKVGIVNPSGETETFCVAAAEIQSLGVPVVTIRKFGLRDTVRHNQTGLQYRFKVNLSRLIVKLLLDENLRKKLGKNGPLWTRQYDIDTVLDNWEQLIHSLPITVHQKKDYFRISSPKFQYLLASINGLLTKFISENWPTIVDLSLYSRLALRRIFPWLKVR
jgi:glycosyltransferase involved in cell wall biosynthesis